MDYVKSRIVVVAALFLLLAGLCFLPAIAGTARQAGEGEVQGTACEYSVFYLEDPPAVTADAADDAVAVTNAAPAATKPLPAAPSAPEAPVEEAPVDEAPAPEEPLEPAPEREDPPDEFKISAVNPSRPHPDNLVAEYRFNWGIWTRVRLSWDGVSDPDFLRYYVLRWTGADFGSMMTIFNDLAALEPAAQPYVQDLQYQGTLLGQPGWTDAERKAILDDAEVDLDALNYYIAVTPGAGSLLSQYVALADIAQTTNTNYTDTDISSFNDYYLYAVAAAYVGGDTSLLSNEEVIFSVYVDGSTPAQPTGFTATAYDPGVGLQWNRNTEYDLAGYNVYLMEGGTPVQLNSSLIEFGTEYFHDTGVSGSTYLVEAVDLWGNASPPAAASSALAPTTIYEEDDPAWQLTGEWVSEDYVLDGGAVLLVGRDAGATASITFTGRMVKVISAYYWTCGEVRFYVDGQLQGTRSLYNPSTQWHMQPFVITGLAKGQQHTLTIEATGVAGPGGYSFVNFDYVEVR